MSIFGIIGGSGMCDLELQDAREVEIDTPFGRPSAPFKVGKLNGREVAFLPRFGVKHQLSPSAVPYRANIYAMKKLGVSEMVSVSAVGSLKKEWQPGMVIYPTQIIDFTKNRHSSFFTSPVVHVPMKKPTCPYMPLFPLGEIIYVCIEGNRFSTRAESYLWRALGCDVIGMTAAPEAFLAREAGIHFSMIAQVTDYDSWNDNEVSVKDIQKSLKQSTAKALDYVKRMAACSYLIDDRDKVCHCRDEIRSSCITADPQFSDTDLFIMERK